MGTHRAGPPADGDAIPEPLLPPLDDPAPGRRTRADRKAERLAKTERAVAEYARRDTERAQRRAERRGEPYPPPGPYGAPGGSEAEPGAGPAGWFEDPAPGSAGASPGPGHLDAQVAGAPRGNASRQKAHQEKPRREKAPPKEPRVKEKRPKQPRPKDPGRTRRRVVITSFTALGLAAAVGGGLAVANFAESAPGEESTRPPVATMSAAALKQLTSVPPKVLDEVGAGSAVALLGRVDAPALRSGKKPRLLYIGAESCPLCAVERWPLVVALSRFGTWSNLGVILSPEEELYPNTPTLSFHGATYTSKYLAFSGFETTSRIRTAGQYVPLDALSAADANTLRTLRTAPYVPEEATSRLPFIDLGGKFVGAGTHVRAAFVPFFTGKTHDQIAASLADPGTALAKAVDGGANAYTAAICETLPKKSRPAAVCSSVAAKSGKSVLRAKR